MTINVGLTTATGTYPITVTATGGTTTHTTTVNLTVTPLAAWQKGFDFRATSGFVTDPLNATYVLSNTVYPTTRNGVTFGWTKTSNQLGGIDRTTAVDVRLAGINYMMNFVPPSTFVVDLPAPGTYQIMLAMGDASASQCPSGCKIEFRDGATSLFTLIEPGTTAGYFYDANGNNWPAAAWPASVTARTVTVSGTQLQILVGANSGKPDRTPIAHVSIISAGP
jgi:hypothetical protein